MLVWNWIFAPLVRTLTNAGAGFLVGWGLAPAEHGHGHGNVTVGLICGAVAGGIGAVHGWTMSAVGTYAWSSAVGWIEFLVDNTWSLLNSIVSSLYLLVNFITVNTISSEVPSAGTGGIMLRRGIFPGFATTLGNVVAGVTSSIRDHELTHMLQGRIFGPLYIPLVMFNYIFATIIPYWWIYHNHTGHPIHGLGDYFMKGVYPHTWNEEWAYKVGGTPP